MTSSISGTNLSHYNAGGRSYLFDLEVPDLPGCGHKVRIQHNNNSLYGDISADDETFCIVSN